jgi:16S rRNA processing protein RimM
MDPVDLRTIGIVAGAHGLQGTLRVDPLSDFPERYAAVSVVYLRRGEAPPVQYHIKQVRWRGAQLLVSLREVKNRSEAESHRGAELCVAESDTWKLPADVYYETDLIGFAAVDEQGARIGVLKGVLHAAQDILEIEGEEVGSLLVPFVAEWVGRVDSDARTIEIRDWKRLAQPESVNPPGEPDDH